jgi:hypothetical protein
LKEAHDRALADTMAPNKARMRLVFRNGKRARREVPLLANDLYLDGARVHADTPVLGCKSVICKSVKLHPVAYILLP